MTKQQQTTRDQAIADRAPVERGHEYQWRRQLIEERMMGASRAQNERMAQAKTERLIRHMAGVSAHPSQLKACVILLSVLVPVSVIIATMFFI